MRCTCSLRRVVVFHAIIKSLDDSHTRRSPGGLGREVELKQCTVWVWWADRGRAEPRLEGIACVYVYVRVCVREYVNVCECLCVCLCVSVCACVCALLLL